MKNHTRHTYPVPTKGIMALLVTAAIVSACGGSSQTSQTASPSTTQASAAPLASATTILQMDVASLPDSVSQQVALPAFHTAPVLLNEPYDTDATRNSSNASARMRPHTQSIPSEFQHLSSRRLTAQMMAAVRNRGASFAAENGSASAAADTTTPMASTSVVSTYTPAQIRAAYGLPTLPGTGTLTTAQAAQLGAGQTIYIVDAMNDPNAAAELSTFNTKFGLPACTTKTISTTTALPLSAASASTCELSVVYSTTAGAVTNTAPAYDSGWATEIALDIQWAHATAPLARLVVIEAPDASINSLVNAVLLANKMGPGVVSMSFGGGEGSWTASVDAAFTSPNMTYLAATGDNGAGVSWPAVSTNVVAVGGTSLTYSGSGTRSEVSWSGTGGGTSAYVATPSYQTAAVPGMGTLAHRTVADVSFNADPSTGQYLAVIPQGSTTANWLSAGGTSLSTPQWAGIIAIANAQRAAAAKSALGAPHSVLYTQISTASATYALDFADVTKGSDGTCATCTAKTGYDPLTGLGTPNVSNLLTSLTGTSAAPVAPVVTPATISGMVGTALSFTVSVTSPDPVTYTLTGAPSGMAISTTGAVTWATPVAGTYAVTVTAKDSKTALSGQGLYTVVIAPLPPPVVTPATISGKVGTALSFSVTVTAPDPVTYTLTGAPSGMSISTAGVVSWATPLAGTSNVTLTAKDSKTGLSGQGVYTVVIAALPAPIVTSASVTGTVGTALSFATTVTSPDAVTYTLTGAPSGLAISTAGIITWAAPVAGTYSVTVTAKDTKTGLSGQGVISVTINASGPVITAPAMTGVAGKPMTGTITVSDPGVSALSLSISGIPMGMMFSANGLTITATWPNPVTGTYSLTVIVKDSAGRTAQKSVPITITAK